jgi:uncharacterized protein YbcV (DUF1398 family)
MFTLEQIKSAHAKVQSGADFPNYVQELKQLGVTHYEAYVSDGHTAYFGKNNYKIKALAKYDSLTVAENSNIDQFKTDLKSHQQGQTDYMTFCNDCAKSGVEKWLVCMEKMTCTYYAKDGKAMLTEAIPG